MRPALALLALLALAAPAAGEELDLKNITDKTSPAVVRILVGEDESEPSGTGSGFFIAEDGVIVTNHHVIEGASRVVAELANGKKVAALGLLADDEQKDLAFLKVEGGGYPALQLSATPPAVGEPVAVVGSPMGLTTTVSNGVVAAVRDSGPKLPGRSSLSGTEYWRVQITAPVSPGSSGSPVVNARGEVVAVAVGILAPGIAQNLNFGIPVQAVHELSSTIELDAEPRPFSQKRVAVRNLVISGAAFLAVVLLILLVRRKR